MNQLTPEQISEARAMRCSGIAWHRIAYRFGVNPETIQRRIDPEFQKRLSERRGRGVKQPQRISPISFRPTEADYRAGRKLIPDDDRDLTGSLMGDPVFQRSALYRRQANAP